MMLWPFGDLQVTYDLMALALFVLYLLYERWTASVNDVKTIKDIPGPKPSYPIIGTAWIYSKQYSLQKLHEAHADLFQTYGSIFKEEGLWNKPIVHLKDKADIDKVARYPSKHPLRPPTEAASYYRRSRPDRYASTGIVNEQGTNWSKLREGLTREITSVKNISSLNQELNLIIDDFIALVKSLRKPSGHVSHFEDLCNRMGVESSSCLILGRRMGFLEEDMSEIAQRLSYALDIHFAASRDTNQGLPIWKYFSTKPYKMFIQSEDEYYNIISEFVDSALKDESETCLTDGISYVFMSILKADGIDIRDKKAAIIDFIASGVKTLGSTLVYVLYCIAKHPQVQERLFQEIVQLTGRHGFVSTDDLRNASYIRACIQEVYRYMPAAPAIARILEEDTVLSGYKVPAGTMVLLHNRVAGLDEKNFTNAHKFMPERWLPHENHGMKCTPSVVMPFGTGKRMCPGKRFIDVSLHLIVAKIVREFHIEFEGELEIINEFLLFPKGPLTFTLNNRE